MFITHYNLQHTHRYTHGTIEYIMLNDNVIPFRTCVNCISLQCNCFRKEQDLSLKLILLLFVFSKSYLLFV